MAEAEEVIADAARHATVFIRDLWRRHQPPQEVDTTPGLGGLKQRLDLLITATFAASLPLRPAQAPPRPTLLGRLFDYDRSPRARTALPATDSRWIWLPPRLDPAPRDAGEAVELYRVMALQQAVRAHRGSAERAGATRTPLAADVLLLLEACDADADLVTLLPGTAASLRRLRRYALAARPPLTAFPPARRPLERLVSALLRGEQPWMPPAHASPDERIAALVKAHGLLPEGVAERTLGPRPLLRDYWTGTLLVPDTGAGTPLSCAQTDNPDSADTPPAASARLARRPTIRPPQEGEDEDDDSSPGAWMVQADEPHLHAEDPFGLQRPTDRDDETSAEDYADLASELAEARLVATPGRPKEVLLADDPPDTGTTLNASGGEGTGTGIAYPEWDYRTATYRTPGATVRIRRVAGSNPDWVEDTLSRHRTMLQAIRRRFELLRAQRTWQRRQTDGEEIDLDAWVAAHADFRAGQPFPEDVYRSRRSADRALAITLLIDVSGSTDSWIGSNRRIIDVEREALLLVCIALQGLGEPFSVLAFSGQGPEGVVVRNVKTFDEPYGEAVALRISSLEPEHYTRAGAALRHAAAGLMRQPASHRLLLLLSDGKPNDVDLYEGRYGVEDMRQAVTEARLQDIHPFCLTIDRQAANYLPRVFGPHQYALLPDPERLPLVLLEWIRRLLVS